MPQSIIEVRNLSKCYRLGQLGARTLREDAERLWRRLRGKDQAGSAGGPPEAPPAGDQDFWALRDVSFEVQPGEVLGIVGRNGAGKSTLLKILSRITRPTTGDATLRGRVASLLEVGTGFHPELSGRENIFLNGAILGMKKAEVAAKFDEIVAFAEVERFIDTPVKRYSSGMYVRLAFAVAAHLEPEILIVDEVLAVGDAAFQQKCLGKMQAVSQGQGRTVLFVSHSIPAIKRLCHSALLLESGHGFGPVSVERAIERYVERVQVTAKEMDLNDQPRAQSKLGKICRLRKIKLSQSDQLLFGRPCEIEIEFEVREPVTELMAGIGFNTMDGFRLISMDSDALTAPWNLSPGIYNCTFKLDYWPLSPSLASVSLALVSGHNCHDFINSGPIWETGTSSADCVSDRGFGGCRLQHQISLRKVLADPGEIRHDCIQHSTEFSMP